MMRLTAKIWAYGVRPFLLSVLAIVVFCIFAFVALIVLIFVWNILPLEVAQSETIATVRDAVRYVEQDIYRLEGGNEDKNWLKMTDTSPGSKEQERFGVVFHRKAGDIIVECGIGFDASIAYNMNKNCWDTSLAGHWAWSLTECEIDVP